MSDAKRDYWSECVANALEECGLEATREQIDSIAGAVESAHEHYGMAFYSPPLSEYPVFAELEAAKKALKREQDMIHCRECRGTGQEVSRGVSHVAISTCDKCNGHGRHDP